MYKDGTSATTTKGQVLPQCEACSLLGQLVGFTGTLSSYGNQPDTCT